MWDRSSNFSKEDVRSSFLWEKEQVGPDKSSFHILSPSLCLPPPHLSASPPCLPSLSLSSSSPLFLPLSVGSVRGAAERLGLMCGCCVMTEGFTNTSHPSGRLVKLVQKGVRKDRIAELRVSKTSNLDIAKIWSCVRAIISARMSADAMEPLNNVCAQICDTQKQSSFYSLNTICLSVHTDPIWTCFEMLLE